MSFEELSSVLWRERELLDLLAFKLEVEQLVLATGRSRWLAPATREIETVLEQIRDVELLRAVAVDTVALSLGLEAASSLDAIAERSPEPWAEIWRDHLTSFRAVAAEISEMSQNNRALLTAGYQAAQATLLAMADQSDQAGTTYDADGVVATDRRAGWVDRSL